MLTGTAPGRTQFAAMASSLVQLMVSELEETRTRRRYALVPLLGTSELRPHLVRGPDSTGALVTLTVARDQPMLSSSF